MAWTETDARRSNRRWVILAASLLLVPLLLWAALSLAPYAWSWAMWNQKVARAQSISDYTRIPAGSSYASIVQSIGEPLYSGPGFANSYGPYAGVYYWSDADGNNIRGLLIDWSAGGEAKLVGSMKAGVW